MNLLDTLSSAERNELLLYPAYITLLAVNADGKLNNKEKNTALKLSHIRSYSATPGLRAFYSEAEKLLEQEIERLDETLPNNKAERETILTSKLRQCEEIASKLDQGFGENLIRSMNSFKNHVSAAHGNVLEYLIFPVAYSKIT